MINIEFVKEAHVYLIDGIIVPSVTEILRETLFPDLYENIPQYILEKASKRGKKIHKAIEKENDTDLSFSENLAYKEWLFLKNKYEIQCYKNEVLVHYKNLYCGRIDLIAKIEDTFIICDIKTTYKLNIEYISWQLSFYKYAYENMFNKKLSKAYCIWLPNKKMGKLVEIETKSKIDVINLAKNIEDQVKEAVNLF